MIVAITRELRRKDLVEAAGPPRVRTANPSAVGVDEPGLIDYCSRPSCRREFRRGLGPGRRQAYCSEICRRTAEREYRQLRARLAHFEDVVEKLRIDVAAFGRLEAADDPGEEKGAIRPDTRRTAEDAVRRAAGALEFADPDEPAVRELRKLYEAIAPIVLPMTAR
jgi:hypothetical protein